jgi:hypothetical protein
MEHWDLAVAWCWLELRASPVLEVAVDIVVVVGQRAEGRRWQRE